MNRLFFLLIMAFVLGISANAQNNSEFQLDFGEGENKRVPISKSGDNPIKIEKERLRTARMRAWAQMDSIYQQMPDEEKNNIRKKLSRHDFLPVLEENGNFIRASIIERQLLNDLRSAFGSIVCDTLMYTAQLGWYTPLTYYRYGYKDITKISPIARVVLDIAMIRDLSSGRYPDILYDTKWYPSEDLEKTERKVFNVLEVTPIIEAHKYPDSYSYFVNKDDSLAFLFKSRMRSSSVILAQKLLEEKERIFGKHHPIYALALNDFAVACKIQEGDMPYSREKRMNMISDCLTQAIEIYKQANLEQCRQLAAISYARFLNNHQNDIGYLTLLTQKQLDSLATNKRQQFEYLQSILGDTITEMIKMKKDLQIILDAPNIIKTKRHEEGENAYYISSFKSGVNLFKQKKYKHALDIFSGIQQNEKFNYLNARRYYSNHWKAACYLHLGDTIAAKKTDTYYMLTPIDRSKTLELDYLYTWEPENQRFLSVARDSFGDGTVAFAHMLLIASDGIRRADFKTIKQKNDAYKQATNYLQLAKSILKKNAIINNELNAQLLYNLANLYYSMHYFRETVLVLDEALPIIALTKGKKSNSYSVALKIMIDASIELKDYSRIVQLKEEEFRLNPQYNTNYQIKILREISQNLIYKAREQDGDKTSLSHAIEILHQAISLQTTFLQEVFPKELGYEDWDSIQSYVYSKTSNDVYDLLIQCHSLLDQKKEAEQVWQESTMWLRNFILSRFGSDPVFKNQKDAYCYYFCVNKLAYIYIMIGRSFYVGGDMQNSVKALEEASKFREKYRLNAFYSDVRIFTQNEYMGTNAIYGPEDFLLEVTLGMAQYLSKNYEKSITILQKAMRIYEESRGIRSIHFTQPMFFLVNSLTRLERYDEAAACAADLWQLLADDRLKNLAVRNVSRREQYWNENKVIFELTIPFHFSKITHPSIPAILYDNTLLYKGLLLNTEIEIGRLIRESGDVKQQTLYNQLRENQLLLASEMLKSDQQKMLDTDSLQTVIISQENALLGTLQQENSSDIIKGLRFGWHDVQKQLALDDVAIEFMAIPMPNDSTVFYALTLKEGYLHPRFTKLFTLKDLKLINKSDYYSSSRLYDILWRPLQGELKGTKNIYFSPTGSLHQIGIEYLPGMESYNMYRLSSTRELAVQNKNNEKKSFNATLYGGLKFELTDVERDVIQNRQIKFSQTFRDTPDLTSLRQLRGVVRHMPILEGSQKEVVDIDSLMRKKQISVTTLLGTNGTEESFKALSGQHRSILHISTHGFYQPEERQVNNNSSLSLSSGNPQVHTEEDRSLSRSGLLMTGAADYIFGRVNNIDKDDGILTAREISRMDLSGLDLVVLSACETGLGDISGEGVFGLQRGFKKAGAQTLLVSLWKVEDEATQLLMTEFYRNLLSGLTKRQAFFKAQHELRMADNGRFNRYECWAAFVLIDGLR